MAHWNVCSEDRSHVTCSFHNQISSKSIWKCQAIQNPMINLNKNKKDQTCWPYTNYSKGVFSLLRSCSTYFQGNVCFTYCSKNQNMYQWSSLQFKQYLRRFWEKILCCRQFAESHVSSQLMRAKSLVKNKLQEWNFTRWPHMQQETVVLLW